MSLPPRYVTTPIYYLNAKPHLGHAYTTVAADFLARFWRLEGRPTYFLTGTDEHGQKIAAAAEAQGLSPQAYVDQMTEYFKEMTQLVGAEPDDFLRTTEERHKKGAQVLWTKILEAGFIYRGVYAGWYAVRDEAYYNADEIQDGKAPTGAPVTWVEEACYFFKLSAFQEPLLQFYTEHPDFIAPTSRYNEVKRWVERGLQDLAVSRSTFSWGVQVPEDPEHVMYVWIEALSNYITGIGYPETETPLFRTFWPQALQLVGKDILRFHGVYWPAFLMAAGLPPPRKLFAHGWWTNEGQKISKSVGNVVDPLALIKKFGLDPFRYFILREISFGSDGDFSERALLGRLNADLANDLGNLAQRVLSFIHKTVGAVVPQPISEAETAAGQQLKMWLHELYLRLQALVEAQAPHKYLEALWEGISLGNQFVDTLKPWALAKSSVPEDIKTLQEGLATLLELLRQIGLFILPVMPGAGNALLTQLGVPLTQRTLPHASPLKPGEALPAPYPLFPRQEG